jgi:hypothetical protein
VHEARREAAFFSKLPVSARSLLVANASLFAKEDDYVVEMLSYGSRISHALDAVCGGAGQGDAGWV